MVDDHTCHTCHQIFIFIVNKQSHHKTTDDGEAIFKKASAVIRLNTNLNHLATEQTLTWFEDIILKSSCLLNKLRHSGTSWTLVTSVVKGNNHMVKFCANVYMHLRSWSLYITFESGEGCRVVTQKIHGFIMSNLIGQKFSIKEGDSVSLVERRKEWKCV